MKKTLLALATATMTMSSMAATSNSLSISMPSTDSFKKVLENMTSSVEAGFERQNVNIDNNSTYLNLNVGGRLSSDLNLNVAVRTKTQDINHVEDNPYQMINPRITLSGYNFETRTALGDLLIAPSFRVEANTTGNKGDNYGKLATARLGAFSALKTSAANKVTLFAATYGNISDSEASSDVKNESHFYLSLGDQYSINDTNNVSFSFDHFSNFNLETFRDVNVPNQNEFYLNYNNSSIKGLRINPYLLQNLGKTVAFNNMAIGLNLTYTLK